MPTFNTAGFIQAAKSKGFSENQISNLLQSKGLDPNKQLQEIAAPGSINFIDRLKASFGTPTERARGGQLETQSGLRGKLDIGDLADIGGAVPSFLGYLGGGALGSAGGPAGTIVGGAAGAAAGEAARQGIGKLLGVQKDATLGGSLKEIGIEGGTALAAGGIAAGANALAKMAFQKLPTRLTTHILKDSRAANAFLEKGEIKLGGMDAYLDGTNKAIRELSGQIDSRLVQSGVSESITGKELVKAVKAAFPDSRITASKIENYLLKVSPEKQKVIEKLFDKGLSLTQANSLRSTLDRSLKSFYKQIFSGNTNQAFVKDVTNGVTRSISEMVKVKSKDEAVRGLFEELSKELTIRNAIRPAIQRYEKSAVVGVSDLIGAGVGSAFGGPVGAGIGAGARRIISSPRAALPLSVALKNIGKVGGKLATPAVRAAGRTSLFELLRQANR